MSSPVATNRPSVKMLARKATKLGLLAPGIASRRRTGDVVILLYHRLGDAGAEIDLPVNTFERHLAILREHERVITIDELLSPDSQGGVVVTFDDGYADFYEAAVPLLDKYRIPAILYLTTSFVSGEHSQRRHALSWSQLHDAASSGLVSIGAHTHGHVHLGSASETAAEDEMRRSKELIEDNLGRPCRHFSYPWSIGSAGADRAARRLFDTAALYAWKTNRHGRIDPYRLGRVPVLRSDGSVFFRAKLRGLLDSEALAYRALRRGPWRRG